MALEIESFVGPCEIARADRRVQFVGSLDRIRNNDLQILGAEIIICGTDPENLTYVFTVPYFLSTVLNFVHFSGFSQLLKFYRFSS